MWFKNLIVYRFTRPFKVTAESLEAALGQQRFSPCSSQQTSRYGWSSPFGKHSDALVHSAEGRFLICGRKEEKILPAAVVKDFLDEKVETIEQEQDRKVRKKERNNLKDEVIFELLPQAFSRYQETYAYIDCAAGILVVDASSAKRAEELCSFLRKTLGSLPISTLALKHAPAATMTHWLSGETTLPPRFTLGDEAELKDMREQGAVIRCKQQELLSDEIAIHLQSGKQVTKISLEYADNFRFILGEDLIIRRLKYADSLIDKAADMSEGDAAASFDADFVLMTAEFDHFIPELIAVLGGENTEVYSSL